MEFLKTFLEKIVFLQYQKVISHLFKDKICHSALILQMSVVDCISIRNARISSLGIIYRLTGCYYVFIGYFMCQIEYDFNKKVTGNEGT